MEIEEVDALIFTGEAEMKTLNEEKKKILKKTKNMTTKAKEKALEPVDE
jgi:hypothetical protein